MAIQSGQSRRGRIALASVLGAAALGLLLWWLARGRGNDPQADLDGTPPGHPASRRLDADTARAPPLGPLPRPTQTDGRAQRDAGPAQGDGTSSLASFQRLVELGQGASAHDAIQENAKKAKAYVDRFCGETSKVRVDGGVADAITQGSNDAAAFMNSQIDYERPLDKPPGLLHLPDVLLERVRGYGAAWPARVTAGDLAGLDFSWLTQLQQYDSWSLLASGPLASYPVGDVLYYPLPNYSSVTIRAKLRYALGLAGGDVAQASREVLHLAELIRGQGLLVSELSAVQLYRIDGEARAAATQMGLDVSGWTPLDPALRVDWRDMANAGRLFTLPDVSPDVVRKALDCMPSPCPAIVEGVSMGKALSVYGETDNVPLLLQLGAEHGCESELLSRLGAAETASPYEALDVLHEDLAGYFPPSR